MRKRAGGSNRHIRRNVVYCDGDAPQAGDAQGGRGDLIQEIAPSDACGILALAWERAFGRIHGFAHS